MKKYKAQIDIPCFNCSNIIKENEYIYVYEDKTLCLRCAFLIVVTFIYEQAAKSW